MVGRGRELCTESNRGGLDLQTQTEYLAELGDGERTNLKAAVGENINQALGLQLHQRLAHRDLAGAEFRGEGVLAQRRAGRVRARQNAIA
jgi:hypothetical protein